MRSLFLLLDIYEHANDFVLLRWCQMSAVEGVRTVVCASDIVLEVIDLESSRVTQGMGCAVCTVTHHLEQILS